jgi:hypothetical protein
MDEEVQPEHVHDDHAAHQLIERLAWAVCDANEFAQRTADRGRRPVGHQQ